MEKGLSIIKGSISPAIDPHLESFSIEAWLDGEQILRLGRYRGEWKVTLMDSFQIDWDDLEMIFKEFSEFIPLEEQAIKREQQDGID